MKKGRRTQVIGQAGEYLVAAELSRRGLITTTFTANVPHYDIIASDEVGNHYPIQVKAIKSQTWQLDITKFVNIIFDGDKQILGRKNPEPVKNLLCVFLELKEYGEDVFYIFSWKDLQRILVADYSNYLKLKGSVRPKNPKTTHIALKPFQLNKFKDQWDIILDRFKM